MAADRIFTTEEIRGFTAAAQAREKERAERVTTKAGRALVYASRTVIDKDHAVLTITDGDVLDAILAIEAELR